MGAESSSSDEVAEKLSEWQQGDFALECRELWFRDTVGSTEESDEESDFGLDDDIEGVVVISQTCDVVRHPEAAPYVIVCPLIRVPEQKVRELSKGLSPRTCFIANVPTGIVVDLSRAMTISKELLVTWDRQRGCTNSREQREFARALEGVFGRFAFPEDFVASVSKFRRKVVDTYAKDNSDLGQAFRSIAEFRAYPHSDWSNDETVPITFIAVLDEPGERELADRAKIFDIVSAKIREIDWQGVFSAHSESLILQTYADLRAVDYLNSYPLELNSLSFARRYLKK